MTLQVTVVRYNLHTHSLILTYVPTKNYLRINANEKYQSIDGFGFTLTGGSVDAINRLGSNLLTHSLTHSLTH